jgi:hypothetical protein
MMYEKIDGSIRLIKQYFVRLKSSLENLKRTYWYNEKKRAALIETTYLHFQFLYNSVNFMSYWCEELHVYKYIYVNIHYYIHCT